MSLLKPPVAIDVDEYLSRLPQTQRAALQHVRQLILREIPDVTEKISYQIPTYRRGKFVIHFAAFPNHLSLIPLSKEIKSELADDLKGFEIKGSTLRFTPEHMPGDELLVKLIRSRIVE